MRLPDPSALRRYLARIDQGDGFESVLDDADFFAGGGPQGEASTAEMMRARQGLESVRAGAEPDLRSAMALEAIILPRLRPVIDVIGGGFEIADPLWAHLAAPGGPRDRLMAALPAIGRVEVPSNERLPYAGTGFVVGDGLLMTNRHVAELFSLGLGAAGLRLRSGHEVRWNPLREKDGDPKIEEGATLHVRSVRMIHPHWDMALLEVDGLTAPPLTLTVEAPGDMAGREVGVIGYPAEDSRNDIDLQMRLFRGAFQVKRLQPGKIGPRRTVSSFGRQVDAVTHDASTLGGNSGSAVVDTQTGRVASLHFAGRYLDANFSVPASELARDGRVRDAGVRFEGGAADPSTAWDDAWAAADQEAAPAASAASAPAASASAAIPAPGAAAVSAAPVVGALAAFGPGGTASVVVPLTITVTLGASAAPQGAGAPAPAAAPAPALAAPAAAPAAPVEPERMATPPVDPDYCRRPGYDPDFLELSVPMPSLLTPAVAAPRLDGRGAVLDYHHFSAVMHGARRLALFTAANMDGSAAAKRPEPFRDYTRQGISGLGRNDREKWLRDPRIAAEHQLDDRFFNNDRQAFDKGHIVRRDDIAFGADYEELRRANNDSYHITNCGPQVKGFNRAGGDWFGLESEIMRQGKAERYCLFAGPLFHRNDRWFDGETEDGPVRVKIPWRWWKVLVCVEDGALAAYAFVLKQSLADVDFSGDAEFAVNADWREKMISIPALEARIGALAFPEAVRAADRIDAPEVESIRAAFEG